MPTASFNRMYIILRPVDGQAAGFVRVEGQRSRSRLHVHASQLPQEPVRALLLAGDVRTGAILDLGLMHAISPRHAVLSRDDLALQGGYHTLILSTDWPEPRVLLYGCLGNSPGWTLWQMQEVVQRYLAVPAGEGAAQASEPAPGRSVLMLRQRDST